MRRKLKENLDYAYEEFGAKTMKRWIEQIDYFRNSVKKYPTLLKSSILAKKAIGNNEETSYYIGTDSTKHNGWGAELANTDHGGKAWHTVVVARIGRG